MTQATESNKEQIKSFNIALFPESKELISECIKLAQHNFSAQADGYLLGQSAWPHITLCKFESRINMAEEIWNVITMKQSQTMAIVFDHFYLKPGQNKHLNKYWVGIVARPDGQLTQLQSLVFKCLKDLGIESDTKPENYFPHLTWARCSSEKLPTISLLPSTDFWLNSHPFRLSLGQSSPNGIYNKQLFPQDNSEKTSI